MRRWLAFAAGCLATTLVAGMPAGRSAAATGARELPSRSQPATPASEDCGPIAPDDAVRSAALEEAGVRPSRREGDGGPGPIVPLPAAEQASAGAAPGEALLALPKGPDGQVPTEFELAPGATVASSFFSPVMCATVVRIVGPATLSPEELVTSAPESAVAVANDVYLSAQAELRPFDPGGEDPYRPLQWGLERSGAERAWAVADGSGARVALLDSAPDAKHRDLARVRVVALPEGEPAAVGAHGSLMAGVVGAVTGNDFGIAGLAPAADLIGVAVCRPRGATANDECRLFELLRGVDLAWEQGAQVLNVSLVGPPNRLLRRAMDRIDALGVLVVAAAGNEGVAEPRYPAAYPSVIGVGAIDSRGAPYARGNRGASVEVVAPGVEILSTVPGGFAFGDGTSLAAAHVSGVLALAMSASRDSQAARAAFFQAAQARVESPGNQPAVLPAACEVLAALGKPCR
jgi:subtilisin family serine protease